MSEPRVIIVGCRDYAGRLEILRALESVTLPPGMTVEFAAKVQIVEDYFFTPVRRIREFVSEITREFVLHILKPKNRAEAGDWEQRERIRSLRVRTHKSLARRAQRAVAWILAPRPRCKLARWPSLKERRRAWRIGT